MLFKSKKALLNRSFFAKILKIFITLSPILKAFKIGDKVGDKVAIVEKF